jgi:hypothetical protein
MWLRSRPSRQLPEQQTTAETPALSTYAEPALTKQPAVAAVAVPVSRSNAVSFTEQQFREQFERGGDEWRTPIAFYGKVVDENDQPVPNAQIDFACNDLSAEGTSSYRATSDDQGLFSISGIQGKLLTAKVSKAGYYTSKRDNASFYYAGQNENFVPDLSQPILFHLRKVGMTEPLMAMAGSTAVPKDGSPVGVSLTRAKITPPNEAELVVQCWTDDEGKRRGEKYNWRCQITVPGGGIQEYDGEFPFLAPESGYQLSAELNMPANLQGEWRDKAARNYFLRLGSGNYARIQFEMIPYGEHFFLIESYVNPSGSRNLESATDIRRTRLVR